MRLKARLRRLRADVDWLKTWGALRAVELRLEMLEVQRAMERVKAARVAKAAKPAVVRPALRDAPLRDAPQGEVMPIERPPPHPEEPCAARHLEGCQPARPEPPPEIIGGQPPEFPELFRPVTWRKRGPQDWDDDTEDMVGRCYVDYDPLEDTV